MDLKQYSQKMFGLLDSSGKNDTVTTLKHYLIYLLHFNLECTLSFIFPYLSYNLFYPQLIVYIWPDNPQIQLLTTKYLGNATILIMIIQAFLGGRPSRFTLNPTIRAFIMSESFVWSAWNFIAPIFAVFATNHITGGNVGVAATVFSLYLIVRVVVELLTGQRLSRASDTRKLRYIELGILLVSLGYIGFAFAKGVSLLFISYAVIGLGMGIQSPAKDTIFSTHLDHGKEPLEWSTYDAIVFAGMAAAAAIGGFIANLYGFRVLFVLAAFINSISLLPYIIFLPQGKRMSPVKISN